MSVTSTIDETAPAGSSAISLGDDAIRLYKVEVRERMNDLGCANWGTVSSGQSAIWASLTTKKYSSPYYDNGNSGAAKTIDFDNSNFQLLTLTANCTLTLSNPVSGAPYILALKQDATGSRIITWPATVKWSGGYAPTLTTTASRTDLVSLIYNGTNYFGTLIGVNYNI